MPIPVRPEYIPNGASDERVASLGVCDQRWVRFVKGIEVRGRGQFRLNEAKNPLRNEPNSGLVHSAAELGYFDRDPTFFNVLDTWGDRADHNVGEVDPILVEFAGYEAAEDIAECSAES